MVEKIDLSLIPTEDLADEIDRRHDICVIAYLENSNNHLRDLKSWFGDNEYTFMQLGICDVLKRDMLLDLKKEED